MAMAGTVGQSLAHEAVGSDRNMLGIAEPCARALTGGVKAFGGS